jgi:Hint domain
MTVLFVSSSFTGTSTGVWNAPYKTLKSAMDAAAAGDSIFVAAGLYDESNNNLEIRVANLTIIGGWKADGSEWSAGTTAASRPTAPNTAVSGDTSKYMTVASAGAAPTAVVGNTTVLKLRQNNGFALYIGGEGVSGVSLNYLHIYSGYSTTKAGALIKVSAHGTTAVPKNITLNYITFENQQVYVSTAYQNKCIDFNGVDGTSAAPNTISNCYIPTGITYGMTLASCHYVNVTNCVFGAPNSAAGQVTPVAIQATTVTTFTTSGITLYNIATQNIVFSNNTWPTYAQVQFDNQGQTAASYPEPTVGTTSGFNVQLDPVLQYLAIGTNRSNGGGGYFNTYALTSYSTYFTNCYNFIGPYYTSLGGVYNNNTAKSTGLTTILQNYDIKDIKSGQDWYVHTMKNFDNSAAQSGSSPSFLLTTVADSRLTTPYLQAGNLIHYGSGATIPAASSLPVPAATISATGTVAKKDTLPNPSAAYTAANLSSDVTTAIAATNALVAGTATDTQKASAPAVVTATAQVTPAAAATIVTNYVTQSSKSGVDAYLALRQSYIANLAASAVPLADQSQSLYNAIKGSSVVTGASTGTNGTVLNSNASTSTFFSTTYLQAVVTPPNTSYPTNIILPTFSDNGHGIYNANVALDGNTSNAYYFYDCPVGYQITYTYNTNSHVVYNTGSALLLDGSPYTLGTAIPFGLSYNYYIYGRGSQAGSATPPAGIACFVSGTRILSQNGYKPIDKFTAKDLLVTSDNRVIDFLLHKTVIAKTDEKTAPYKIEAHAFGRNAPMAPLYLSPTHKIQIRKGLWISPEEAAKTNPRVTRAMLGESVTYLHVECENYLRDNVIAEGMVAESYGTAKALKGLKNIYTWNTKLGAFTRKGPAALKNSVV